MEDYRLVTQRIINKGERILAEKRRRKKRIFRYIATVSSVCGAMSLCISAVAVLKIFIVPETDSKPETPVTTYTTIVSDTSVQTETSILPQSSSETDVPVTDAGSESEAETETTAAAASKPYTKEAYTEPPAETELIVTTVTELYEEEVYTEPPAETQAAATAATEPPKETEAAVTAVTEPPKEIETTVTTLTEAAVTTTEAVTAQAVTSAGIVNGMPVISFNGVDYTFNGVYISQSDAEHFYIAWTEEQTLYASDTGGNETAEAIQIMGITDAENVQEYIIVHFMAKDVYALYTAV